MEEIFATTTYGIGSYGAYIFERNNLPVQSVLIITPFWYGIGGGETFAHDLCKSLQKKYTVDVATIPYTETWEGMDYVDGFKLMLRLLKNTIPAIWNNRYKKIYCLGLIASFVGFLLFWKRKYAVMLCLYDYNRWSPLSIMLNSFKKVFVEAGDPGVKEMITMGVHKNKLVKFEEWIDQSKFYPIIRYNRKLQVLFVGRPIRIKGRHIIEECEREMKGLVDFIYVENVPYEELPIYYQNADICVVPSLYAEGSDRVVAEAASCGCVVIASNKGALEDMVMPFGYVIEPTARNFKDMILYIQRNPKRLEKIRQKTIEYAKAHFSEKNAEVFY